MLGYNYVDSRLEHSKTTLFYISMGFLSDVYDL